MRYIRLALYFLALGPRLAFADYQTGLDAFASGQYEQAYQEWIKMAEAGDPRAQHGIGLLLEKREGGARIDYAEAARWYQLAVDQHFAPAENSLAVLYAQGLGVVKDEDKALDLWRSAASSGNPPAQLHLGNRYAHGLSVPKDEAKALEYWRRAAEGGSARASYNLGLFYRREEDAASLGLAARYFTQAAKDGVAEAQYAMGEMAREGKAISQEKEKAAQWHGAAAKDERGGVRQDLQELALDGVTPDGIGTFDSSGPTKEGKDVSDLGQAKNAMGPIHDDSAFEVPSRSAQKADGMPSEKKRWLLSEGVAQVVEVGQPIFRIWLAEKKSKEDARAEWLTLSSKYSSLLKGFDAQYRRFDLGEKGVLFRLFVGTFTKRPDADKLCGDLRARDDEIFCRSVLN